MNIKIFILVLLLKYFFCEFKKEVIDTYTFEWSAKKVKSA